MEVGIQFEENVMMNNNDRKINADRILYANSTQNLQIEDVALYRTRIFLVYQVNGGTAK